MPTRLCSDYFDGEFVSSDCEVSDTDSTEEVPSDEEQIYPPPLSQEQVWENRFYDIEGSRLASDQALFPGFTAETFHPPHPVLAIEPNDMRIIRSSLDFCSGHPTLIADWPSHTSLTTSPPHYIKLVPSYFYQECPTWTVRHPDLTSSYLVVYKITSEREYLLCSVHPANTAVYL